MVPHPEFAKHFSKKKNLAHVYLCDGGGKAFCTHLCPCQALHYIQDPQKSRPLTESTT